MTRGLAALALATCLLHPASALAQAWTVGAGATVQGYSFADPEQAGASRIVLWNAPVDASASLSRWLTVALGARAADAVVTGPDGRRDGIATLTDVRWAATGRWADGGFTLRLSGTAPVSGASQSLSDAVVAGMTGAELLPFALSRWSNGLDFAADLGLRGRIGRTRLGAEGGVRKQQGEIRIAGEDLGYLPGDEVRGHVTLEREVGRAGLLSLLAGVQRFSPDQALGVELFSSGLRWEGIASYAFPLELRGSGVVFVSVRDFASGDGRAPETLELVKLRAILPGVVSAPHRRIATFGTSLRILGGMATFLPEAELRLARADVTGCAAGETPSIDRECGVDEALLFSAGLAAELGGALMVRPHARVRVGSVGTSGGGSSSVLGWDVGLGMRLRDGR